MLNVENFFNFMDRILIFKDKVITSPFFINTELTDATFANSMYLDDFISLPNTLFTKDFFIFPLTISTQALEDSYEASKFLNYLNDNSLQSVKFLSNNGLPTHTHSYVFDFFRSDIDEFS